jgi:hypothetical protein
VADTAKQGAEQVDEREQPGERHHLEDDGEHEGVAGRHHSRDQRPVPRPFHERVDVTVDDHVDCVGTSGGENAAEHRGDHQPHRRHALLSDEHGRHRRDKQQLDDARLRERDIAGDPCAEREEGKFG